VLLFAGKLGSRRQLDFKYREPGACVLDNLNRLAQTDQQSLPCNDTLDDYLAMLGAPASKVGSSWPSTAAATSSSAGGTANTA
jgi:hypothetical protein